VAVHAEINEMLRRRLGRVPTRWIHSYAFAVVDAAGHDRARPREYVWRLLWAKKVTVIGVAALPISIWPH
jgi:hypothetical protein